MWCIWGKIMVISVRQKNVFYSQPFLKMRKFLLHMRKDFLIMINFYLAEILIEKNSLTIMTSKKWESGICSAAKMSSVLGKGYLLLDPTLFTVCIQSSHKRIDPSFLKLVLQNSQYFNVGSSFFQYFGSMLK